MPRPSPTPPISRLAAILVVLLLVAACESGEPAPPRPAAPSREAPAVTPPAPTDTMARAPLLVAAGDIACPPARAVPTAGECQMEATAQLVESLRPDVVAVLGDLQYERGEAVGFAQSYDRSWGRFKAITRPAPGNHEYAGGKAAGYYGYFGSVAAGADGRGWYSYDLGSWHVVVLNSVCSAVGGCGEGSPQLQWLRADLAASPSACTLAYWHHPRHSSGLHGGDPGYQPFWEALAGDGADIVLSGHDHHYERIAPVDGIRQFVVGTGGRSLYPVGATVAGSEARIVTFGVLALSLRDEGYDWRFLPLPGSSLTDQGSGSCR